VYSYEDFDAGKVRKVRLRKLPATPLLRDVRGSVAYSNGSFGPAQSFAAAAGTEAGQPTFAGRVGARAG